MPGENTDAHARQRVEAVYRSESRRVFATLIRLLGDFDLAEEALHEAFVSAVARAALTLREVCGLTTEEIARAFLTAPPTVAQRIVRAKAKIKDARIPYQIPREGRFARSAGDGAARRLPGVQRRVFRLLGYIADAVRSFGRSDPLGTLARRPFEIRPAEEAINAAIADRGKAMKS